MLEPGDLLHSVLRLTPKRGPELTAKPLPSRLQRPTVEEAVFEVRFVPRAESVIGLLPGVLFSRLPKRYAKHVTLPLASLPPALRADQPDLKYMQQIRLLSEEGFSLFLGDCVAGASSIAPYPGWAAYKPRIMELISVLHESGLIKAVERASFKYVNILNLDPGRQLQALELEVKVGGEAPPEEGFRLRTEHNDRNYRRIVEIVSGAFVERERGGRTEGLLVSLDAILPLPAGRGTDQLTSELVEAVHHEAKALFFKIITADTLASLGPEYEAGV